MRDHDGVTWAVVVDSGQTWYAVRISDWWKKYVLYRNVKETMRKVDRVEFA